MNKQSILGLIGVLWGGGILINHYALSSQQSNGLAYDNGVGLATILAAGMFGAGLRALFLWQRGRKGL